MIDPLSKLLANGSAVQSFLANDLAASPVQVEIAPTNLCNARCPWCFYVEHQHKPRHHRQALSWQVLRQTLFELAELGVKAISWSGGGDPSIYPELDAAIELAHELGLKQGLFTNGYRYVGAASLLAWVRITVTDRMIIPESACQYAEATHTGAVVNLREELVEHLDRLAREAFEAGVHFFQVRPALTEDLSSQPALECPYWLKQYETDRFRVVLTEYKWGDYQKPHGYPRCHGHRLVPFIWYDGTVSVCAYHFHRPGYDFGNLYEQSFTQIWHGDSRRALLRRGIQVISECQHCCKLHEVNKALARLTGELATEHAEFV